MESHKLAQLPARSRAGHPCSVTPIGYTSIPGRILTTCTWNSSADVVSGYQKMAARGKLLCDLVAEPGRLTHAEERHVLPGRDVDHHGVVGACGRIILAELCPQTP